MFLNVCYKAMNKDIDNDSDNKCLKSTLNGNADIKRLCIQLVYNGNKM